MVAPEVVTQSAMGFISAALLLGQRSMRKHMQHMDRAVNNQPDNAPNLIDHVKAIRFDTAQIRLEVAETKDQVALIDKKVDGTNEALDTHLAWHRRDEEKYGIA